MTPDRTWQPWNPVRMKKVAPNRVLTPHGFEEMVMPSNPWGVNTLFGATFFILTGFHGCNVLSGVIYLFCIFVRAAQGAYTAQNNSAVEIVGLYWHFVDLIWILVFTFVYLIA